MSLNVCYLNLTDFLEFQLSSVSHDSLTPRFSKKTHSLGLKLINQVTSYDVMDWQFCVKACSHKINNDNGNSKYFKEPGFNSVDFALEVYQLKR